MRAIGVVHGERQAVAKGIVYMSLQKEMMSRTHMLRLHSILAHTMRLGGQGLEGS